MGYQAQLLEHLAVPATRAVGLLLMFIGGYAIVTTGSFEYLTIIAFRGTSLYYLGYPLSFITFGAFILVFNHKFKALALPLFVLSYTSWEVFEQGSHMLGATEYTFFVGLMVVSVPCAYLVWWKTDFKFALPLFVLYWAVWQFGPATHFSEPLIQGLWCLFVYRSLTPKDSDFIC